MIFVINVLLILMEQSGFGARWRNNLQPETCVTWDAEGRAQPCQIVQQQLASRVR